MQELSIGKSKLRNSLGIWFLNQENWTLCRRTSLYWRNGRRCSGSVIVQGSADAGQIASAMDLATFICRRTEMHWEILCRCNFDFSRHGGCIGKIVFCCSFEHFLKKIKIIFKGEWFFHHLILTLSAIFIFQLGSIF